MTLYYFIDLYPFHKTSQSPFLPLNKNKFNFKGNYGQKRKLKIINL